MLQQERETAEETAEGKARHRQKGAGKKGGQEGVEKGGARQDEAVRLMMSAVHSWHKLGVPHIPPAAKPKAKRYTPSRCRFIC